MASHQVSKPEPSDPGVATSKPQIQSLRLRRNRKQKSSSADQSLNSQAEKVISRKKKTPRHQALEQSFASSSSSTANLSWTPTMASGASSSSLSGPRLTKTGRHSKALKGVKDAHRCGCGKVCDQVLMTIPPQGTVNPILTSLLSFLTKLLPLHYTFPNASQVCETPANL